MRQVAVLAFQGVVAFDLTTPCEIFGRTRTADGAPAYQVRVCGATPWVDAGAFALAPPFDFAAASAADTVIVPGVADIAAPIDPAVLAVLRAAAARGARVASICTGAFLLAAAGVLDGRRAATHWLAAAALAQRYPQVRVDANLLFVDDGAILTSAGATAGIDLCLHMVGIDYGAAVAAETARLAVAPLARAGGQAQYIVQENPGSAASLARLLEWICGHLTEDLSLAALARRAGLSQRTFSRRFRAQVGVTPLQWVLRARLRRAQHLLETTRLSVEQVATEAGFDSATHLRELFHRCLNTTPTAYRRALGGGSALRPALASV